MRDDEHSAGGRPTKYREEFIEQARKLCELGATDLEVAQFFEVSKRTLYYWQQQHPELAQALKVGKVAADDRVERALYHRATGYSFDSEDIRLIDETIEEAPASADVQARTLHTKKVLRISTITHVPPDVTACIFWLKNRRREQWRDTQNLEHSGTVIVQSTPVDEKL